MMNHQEQAPSPGCGDRPGTPGIPGALGALGAHRSLRRGLVSCLLLPVLALGGCGIRNRLIPVAISRLTVTYDAQDATGEGRPSDESAGGFARGIYRVEDDNHLTILLIDGDWESPERLATIRMLWRPRAGRTPVDRSATNATIHLLDFSRGPLGIYSGAGFILPTDPPGGLGGLGGLKVQVTQSTLALADRAPGYPQEPQRASISGRVTLTRDDEELLAAMHRVEQLVLQRLGYPRLVRHEQPLRVADRPRVMAR